MPRPPGEPTVKITMNIYATDYDYLKDHLGAGYSVEIREMIRREVVRMKQGSQR